MSWGFVIQDKVRKYCNIQRQKVKNVKKINKKSTGKVLLVDNRWTNRGLLLVQLLVRQIVRVPLATRGIGIFKKQFLMPNGLNMSISKGDI